MVRVTDLAPKLIKREMAKDLGREPTEEEVNEAMEDEEKRKEYYARITPEVERQIPQASVPSVKSSSPDTSVSSGETKG